jgi:hypothetical protein
MCPKKNMQNGNNQSDKPQLLAVIQLGLPYTQYQTNLLFGTHLLHAGPNERNVPPRKQYSLNYSKISLFFEQPKRSFPCNNSLTLASSLKPAQ